MSASERRERPSTSDHGGRRRLIVAGVAAAIAGYALALADWGSGLGNFGWFLLLAGLGLLAAVVIRRVYELGGGVDWSKYRSRNRPPPDEDQASSGS